MISHMLYYLVKLEFDLRPSYGKQRFYPLNEFSQAIVDITDRKCLNEAELKHLAKAGFAVQVFEGDDLLPNFTDTLTGGTK